MTASFATGSRALPDSEQVAADPASDDVNGCRQAVHYGWMLLFRQVRRGNHASAAPLGSRRPGRMPGPLRGGHGRSAWFPRNPDLRERMLRYAAATCSRKDEGVARKPEVYAHVIYYLKKMTKEAKTSADGIVAFRQMIQKIRAWSAAVIGAAGALAAPVVVSWCSMLPSRCFPSWSVPLSA